MPSTAFSASDWKLRLRAEYFSSKPIPLLNAEALFWLDVGKVNLRLLTDASRPLEMNSFSVDSLQTNKIS